MTHSKSPWSMRSNTLVDANGNIVAVSPGWSGISLDEQTANRNLLSQAPALLKGIKLALMEFERISYQKKANEDIIKLLWRAVALAEGEEG